ncbi:hypothetical protein BDM02DRAFT_3190947 [Thelephora ganbajun]|uniref:Uncharacterized protein n=1 Tax=Thelephora ganbajun TaxID=370292 RepID=A0ACB6Z3R3_THEGA|nr:hypothetical protein BDM02DRAFT_3190947 [Thelephora ganbajun]
MDARQLIEPRGASVSPLQLWASLLSNNHNVVVPWPGGNLVYSQPQTQCFIPGTIGALWAFDAQNLLDQSVGVVAPFPPTSHMTYDGYRNMIASVAPTFDIRRSLNHLVPQRRYANNRRSVRNFEPEPSIYFDTYSGPGFPMKDALDKIFKNLIGREDPMLPDGTAISLRFEFEGYESWTCQVKTRDSRKVPHPIPREKLAYEVAKKLVAFFEKRQVKLDEMDSLGEEAMSFDSVNAKDFVLVRLDHVSKSSWQPQFMTV